MWRGVLFVVARHVDLTPAAEVRLAELFRAAGRVGRRAVTGPHGIVDLGEGDTVWTDPDTGDQHSVRDEAQLAAATRELVRVDGERLAGVIEDAQGLLAEVGQLDDLVAEARGAYTVAGGDPSVADAAGKPVGAVWEVRAGEETVRRFVLTGASTWTPVRVGADAIGAGVISADHIAAQLAD